MTISGRCHCGAIRYTAEGEALHHTICHCSDCRRHAGAPMVGWIAFKVGQLAIDGRPVTYESSEHGRRQFCGACGTGLFYTNDDMLPGLIDIQSCTLDDPEAWPPGAQIQLAERLGWIKTLDALPGFERYPSM